MQYALSCWMLYGIPLSFSQTGAVSTNSPQKVSPIVRDSRTYKRDQFRIHWEEGKKGLPCLDFRGVCP